MPRSRSRRKPTLDDVIRFVAHNGIYHFFYHPPPTPSFPWLLLTGRKHRERKENHLRALEDELHDLYNFISLTEELKEQAAENAFLRDLLVAHSIPFPAGVPAVRKGYLAEVQVVGKDACQCLKVTMPDLEPWSSSDTAGVGQTQDQPHPHRLHRTQVGVDFVLSLEQHCLEHTRRGYPYEPSGHAMSMQGILLAGAPETLHEGSEWETSAAELDRLFELSGSLGLEGFITPVQGWNRIKSHPQFHELTPIKLEELKQTLAENMKCFGFGSIIEEDVFDDLLSRFI
ncbi:hypothetical protein ASPZODRAFT_909954 [Penicilliopsis zonata CBS 506.65]|uniref:Uncharacterized protein n=1 Tax=Penicilliopsis zonata CBS 506.65 TaxID=1073090 RepID=A0A1L9S927_9EURO|nr:hypothetical protein ASPZODRAFT_909954 [Penicilliopsis zonata CBS 506.65]OJJ43663.1 hypothetical protein ASPZODRAFT_909954 [Penicilliopsis zonata CBS 506.65]